MLCFDASGPYVFKHQGMAMKILFLGDSSNYHNSVAKAMAAMGHDVTVASSGSKWMQTDRDIDLGRRPGLWGGFKLWSKMHYLCNGLFKGYDIVQLHDPVFVELRPHRLRPLLEKLKRNNGKIFLTSLANDTPYVRMCLRPDGPLAYNEFRVSGHPTDYAQEHPEIEHNWTHPPLSEYTEFLHENVDGCVTALYEYHMAMSGVFPPEKIAYAGIPIEMPKEIKSPNIDDGPIRIMAACHRGREMEKGFDKLLEAINRAIAKTQGKAVVDVVQNVPFLQFQEILNRAHIVVDQLYSYTPATTALMAMARGKAVVSGGEEDYYRFIGEKEMRPIINPDPRDMSAFEDNLVRIVDDKSVLMDLMRQGPAFVEKHNSAELVARRMLSFWEKTI